VKFTRPGAAAGLLGRFDVALVRDAIRALEEHGDPVILSIGQGSPENDGADRPLRLFSESLHAMVLLMPQKKPNAPYPPMPGWLSQVAKQPVMEDASSPASSLASTP
jgi:hypothetical protein